MKDDKEAAHLAKPIGHWLREKAEQFPMVKKHTMSRLIYTLELQKAAPILGRLCSMSEADIIHLPRLGKTCLDVLLMFLHSDGLSLSGSSYARQQHKGGYEGLVEENRRLRDAMARMRAERDDAMECITAAYKALSGKPAER